MQSVSAAVKLAFQTSPIRKYGRILIDWITPRDLSTSTITTSGDWSTTYFAKENVINGLNYVFFRPFIQSSSLRTRDVPTGERGFYSLSTNSENGWLSSDRSDTSGEFGSAQTLTITLVGTLLTSRVVLVGSKYNYPVDFVIKYKNTSNAWVTCDTYSAVTDYTTVYTFSVPTTIKGISVEITKISVVDMPACIVEFTPGYRDDVSADLVEMEIQKELSYEGPTLDIGNLSANRLTFTLNNVHRRYNSSNADSTVSAYMKANKKVLPYIGVEVAGVITYIPQGVYYIKSYDPKPNMTITIDAYDEMSLMDEKKYTTSPVYENDTLSEAVTAVVNQYGLQAANYSIDPTTATIPYIYFEADSYAKALQMTTQAEGGYCFFGEDGTFYWRNRDWATNVITQFYDEDFIKPDSAQFTYDSSKMKNRIQVYVHPLVIDVQKEIYNSTTPVPIPTGETLVIHCSYNEVPCKDVQNAVYTSRFVMLLKDTLNDEYSALTLLNGGIDANVTTLTVDSTADYSAVGGVLIGTEEIAYSSKNATQFLGCTRGYNGTTKVLHANNAEVYQMFMTINVDSTNGCAASGTLTIEDEDILYSSKTATSFIECHRTAGAVAHAIDAPAYSATAGVTLDAEDKYAHETALTFTNTTTGTVEIAEITIEGKPLVVQDTLLIDVLDQDLIDEYTEKVYEIDVPFVQEWTFGSDLATKLLSTWSDPQGEFSFNAISMPWLQLGDLIAVRFMKFNLG